MSPKNHHRHQHQRLYRWLIALLVLGALVAIASGHAEERRFLSVLRQAEPAWLLAVVALQVATYVCLARVWSSVLARTAQRAVAPTPTPTPAPVPKASTLIGLALAELFTDQALPSGGIGGTIFVVSALERRRVPRPAAGAAVVVSLFGLYLAQLIAIPAGLILLAAEGHARSFTTTIGVIALIAALVTPVLTFAIAAGGIQRLPRRLRRLHIVEMLHGAITDAPREIIFDPRAIARATVWRLAILVLDGATLAAALAAIGHPIAVQDACVVFVLASAAASVSFLPGGLGSFETLAVGLLVAIGTPIEAAVPATLLMRGFSFWLPMLPGMAFARREIALATAAGGDAAAAAASASASPLAADPRADHERPARRAYALSTTKSTATP